MADRFKFELVSPERLLVSEEVEAVVIPGMEGELTAMPNHAPLMTTVKPGVVTVKLPGGAEEKYVVYGGFADIVQDSCTLLAESAIAIADLDRDDLTRRIEAVRAEIADPKNDEHRSRAEQLLGHLASLQHAV